MRLEDYLDFLPNGATRLRGHRIGIEHIVECYQEGLSPEAIADAFPGLSLEQIYGVITYYLRNQADVDTYMAAGTAMAEQAIREYDSQPPAPVVQRLRALKAQRRQEHAQHDVASATPIEVARRLTV